MDWREEERRRDAAFRVTLDRMRRDRRRLDVIVAVAAGLLVALLGLSLVHWQ